MSGHQDNQYEIDLHLSDHYQDKVLILLQLRYQVALIIIPTIIGVWGFLGLIVTSKILSEKIFTIYLLINIGFFITIFLIYIWRKWVYDIFLEELGSSDANYDCLKRNGYSYYKVKEKVDQSIIREQNGEIVKKADPEFHKYLEDGHGSVEDKMEFYIKFQPYLSKSGLRTIDKWSWIISIFILITGFFSPVLIVLLLLDTYPTFSQLISLLTNLLTSLFFNLPYSIHGLVYFLIFGILSLKFYKLRKNYILTKEELQNKKTNLYQKFKESASHKG